MNNDIIDFRKRQADRQIGHSIEQIGRAHWLRDRLIDTVSGFMDGELSDEIILAMIVRVAVRYALVKDMDRNMLMQIIAEEMIGTKLERK